MKTPEVQKPRWLHTLLFADSSDFNIAMTTDGVNRTRNVFVPLVLAVTTLYLGRDFFIPIALAVLISFLLAPVVWRLEQWRFGRVGSVITATALAFVVIGAVACIVASQFIDLANDLPKYKSNLHAKVVSLKMPANSPFSRAAETLKDISSEITGPEVTSTAPNAPASAGGTKPVPVAVIYTPGSAFGTLRSFVEPLFGPLGTAAVVVVFVIFMLLEREDLRDRMIHLIGRGHLQVTTYALNEAGHRVSRYLLAQLIVNTTYGIPIGIGLWLIGVPNAVLWGLLATVLRFVPYIGPWIAAAFPVALSLAVSPGWTMPLLTLGLFIVIELISNNVIEPWLYGSSTGLSPMAIIVAAAFWTWIWGTIGLLLATPLTVCIAVLGKYIPAFSFLDVLLGDRPPIAPEDRFYQRLLAMDEDEICEIAESYTERNSLTKTFDRLIIPALRLADEDYHAGRLGEPEWRKLLGLARELINDLSDAPVPSATAGGSDVLTNQEPAVFCLPASDEADEVAALMLEGLLRQNGVTAQVLSAKQLASEMIEQISQTDTRLVCISVVPPGSTRHAIYYCKRVREHLPQARLFVGIWGESPMDGTRLKRITRAQPDAIALTTMEQAVKEIAATAPTLAAPPAAAMETTPTASKQAVET